MPHKDLGNEFLNLLRSHNYRLSRLSESPPDWELYLVELSDWRLCFTDAPLVWIRQGGNETPDPETPGMLQDLARRRGWQNLTCIALIDCPGENLKQYTKHSYTPRFIVIDPDEQKRICGARSFTVAFQQVVLAQLPLSAAAPYKCGGTVTGSRFFGRTHDVNKLLKPENNFAVIGVRRIGKTSLLREVYRRLTAASEDAERAAWVDCSTLHAYWELPVEVVRCLSIREVVHAENLQHRFNFADFLKRTSTKCHARLVLFLDEVDKLFQIPDAIPELLPVLNAAVNQSHIRLVVAGFSGLASEIGNIHSPFFRLCERVDLGPFDRRATEELILIPMQALGITFTDKNELVTKVFSETRGHPWLVQFYCLELIKRLEEHDSRVLSSAVAEEISSGSEIRELLVRVFLETASAEEKILVYAVLCADGDTRGAFTQANISDALRAQKLYWKPERIDSVCERLSISGVLTSNGPQYKFAVPAFAKNLYQNYPLVYYIQETRDEV